MGWMTFVSSLVGSLAWPAAVFGLVCIVWFGLPKVSREKLLDRLREAGPGGVKFDKAELKQAVGEVRQASAATITGTGTRSLTDHSTEAAEPAEMDTKTLNETQRLIAAAAKWGWIRAGRDAEDFPYPLVTWDKDGARIVGSKSVNPGDTVTYAPGSFIDPNTGKPNRSAHSVNVDYLGSL